MARPDDMEELAAEFALGTLSAAEKQGAEELLASDVEFAGMVKAWERRLIPLALALEPIEAPPRVRGPHRPLPHHRALGGLCVKPLSHALS